MAIGRVPTGAPARTSLRAGGSQEARPALERPLRGSSQPSACPDFTRFELEQLPEPAWGHEALTELEP